MSFAWWLLSLGLVRCGDASSPRTDAARSDGSPEVSADVVPEVGSSLDASPDGPSEFDGIASPDASLDAPADARGDGATEGPDATRDGSLGACADGGARCEDRCVDLATDNAHCGACGARCEPGLSCIAGSCRGGCAPGMTPCAGRCVDLVTDSAHCGTCGRACGAGQSCAAAACRAIPARNCQELLRAAPGTPSGVYPMDPDGPGGMGPFDAQCDMSTDGGGWTLLASGDWRSAYADTVTGPGANAILSDARRAALLATTGPLYRLGDGAQRLFIEDRAAYWAPMSEGGVRHYWRTDGATVRCATSYATVVADALTPVSMRAMNCDPRGVGSHACGSLNGWLLFHDRDTYNVSGAHPCSLGSGSNPTGGALNTLRVR